MDVDNRVLDIGILKNLLVKYRDVILLEYSSKMDDDEIAELLKISERTLRQRLARGKAMMQEKINCLEDSIDGTCERN